MEQHVVHQQEYDLIVLGSGPAGQKAALAAAKQRFRVAVIEQHQALGGVCLHTGTIPSKTLREAVLYFTGYGLHNLYGAAYRPKTRVTPEDLTFRVQHVIRNELEVITDQLQRNGIEMYHGKARFASPHTVEIVGDNTITTLRGNKFVIAVGSEPARPRHIPFTPGWVLDSDAILSLQQIPRTMVVVGAGIIGCEYASIFATLGVDVTLVDSRDRLLEFVDREIVETLIYHMRKTNMTLRLGEAVAQVFLNDRGQVITALASGKRVVAEALLFSIGRRGATNRLNLEAIGLQPDERGRLQVNDVYQTAVERIYAAGDVIGARATEIIHIGQAVMAYGGTVEYFIDTVFNYPALAEAYKIAAFDGMNKL